MKKQMIALLLSIMLFMPGCIFGPDLKPTVDSLRNTIRDTRTRDYEKGRVTFSTKEQAQRSTLTTRIERFMDAENAAADALGETRPYPDVKKAAAKAVAKAMGD